MNRRGFTLIELVIVVALLAILMTLATPSYRVYVMRAHRSEAIAQMLSVAQCQERTRADRGAYDLGLCLPGSLPRYQFAYQAGSGGQGWTVRAQPRDAQATDDCGTLELSHTGARHADGDEWRCWAGR